MFKTKEEVIVIQAEATDPITTGVVFWSHDKGTAKMLFQLQKDYVNQTLSEGTIVPICLDFVGGRHIYHAVIEDAINGIVSIVLEDNILGYVGRVTGSIYIELPDSRSLDTAGRFAFDIRRSPIDETTPELEDFYWEGFNGILETAKELIGTVKSDCQKLLNQITADVSDLENRTRTIESKQAEILKSIADNELATKEELEQSKAESSANVISQVIGKEKVQLTFKTDFLNKETGNFLENKNIARVFVSPTLGNPSTSGNEIGRYDQVSALDGVLYKNGNNVSGSFTQLIAQYDLIELITRLLDERFWIDLGAITILEKANVLKSMLKRVVSSAYGFGKNQDGYKYSQYRAVYNTAGEFTGWALASTHNNSVISKINVDLSTQSQFSTCIDKNGYFSVAIVSEKSDGSTYSELNTDYLHLEFTIELSANEHIKSMIAQNHVENLATQEEAETGTDNTKTMTPLRTAQQIEEKAVTIAGNQTIGGIKNFKDGLMVGGDLAVSKNDHSVFILDSTTSSVIAEGKLCFILHGSLVVVEGSIKFKTDVAYVAMISSSLPDLFVATINNGTLVGHIANNSAKGIYAEKGTNNIKANSGFVANEWFTCSGVYWAGKE